MMEFALLASGSKGNCCVIKDECSSIIIDCGSTQKYLKNCFENLQFDYLKSDALFITHTHTDHISQLKMFNAIKTYAKCNLDTDHFHLIQSLNEIEVNTFKIKEIPLSHDSETTSGYIVENEGCKLVYISDTGYLREDYFPYLKDADYYIFESNHDIEMLMKTKRPMFIKQRILGDLGHLCNEDSATILAKLIGKKTKEIVLAHISEDANSKEKAVNTLRETLKSYEIDDRNIKITAASQFSVVRGGKIE